MSAESAIVEIIKWMRGPVRLFVVLVIVGALALFIPHSWLVNIGIADLLQKYRPLVILIFTISLVWLGTFPIGSQYNQWKRKRYLKRLTEEERNVLRPFILNAKKTQAFAMNLAVARHLVQMHILKESATTDVGITFL